MEIHSAFTWNGQAFKNKEALLSFAQYEDEDAFLFLKALFAGEDHLLVPTSGSTGKPSEIQLPISMMLASSKATGKFFDLKPGSSAFHALPYKYIAGKMMLFRAMHLGLQLFSQQPKIEIKDLGSQMFDFAAMVPLQAESMISEIQRFKQLILGGGQVNVSLQHQQHNITVTAVDNAPDEPRFELTYQFLSIQHNDRVRLKLAVGESGEEGGDSGI